MVDNISGFPEGIDQMGCFKYSLAVTSPHDQIRKEEARGGDGEHREQEEEDYQGSFHGVP